MAGIADDANSFDVFYGDNVDFTGNAIPGATMLLNGQLLIGSTAGRHIQVGTLTSPLGTLTIGYSSPNITIDIVGGASEVTKINVDTTTGGGTNPVLPAAGAITMTGGQYATGSFGTRVITVNSANPNQLTVEAQISSAVAATLITKNGLCHFNSTSFTVDANGFVSSVGSGSGGFTWADKSAGFAAAAANGYHISGSCTATLPAAPSNGDTIKFFVDGAFTLTIQAAGAQLIQLGTNVSSAGGTQANTASGDACEITYRATDTKWCAVNFVGAWNKT